MDEWFTLVPGFRTEGHGGWSYVVSVPAWVVIAVVFLAYLNALLWGCYGVYEFIKVIL